MQIYIQRQGNTIGPFSEQQLHGMLDNNMLLPGDLAWHDALPAWKPLSDVLPSAPTQVASTSLPLPTVQATTQPLASRRTRFMAVLASICFVDLPLWLFFTLLDAFKIGSSLNDSQNRVFVVVCLAPFIAYQTYSLITRGQTVGMRIMRLRLRSSLSSSVSTAQHLVRCGPTYLIWLLSPFAVTDQKTPIVWIVALVWLVLDHAFIFRADRRCLHDHMAKTIVTAA